MRLSEQAIAVLMITLQKCIIEQSNIVDTLRSYIHLRPRTNVFGSVFRIRSSLMKILHDFYHSTSRLNDT